MNTPWTREEVEATVADYFAMLASELRGEPYSKAEHRRRLMQMLNGRRETAVEFKHSNISAILVEHGFPYLTGYKPLGNYQNLLFEIVADRLAKSAELQVLAGIDADREPVLPTVDDILRTLTAPPVGTALASGTAEPFVDPLARRTRAIPTNYLEREARNQRLGMAGEEFVLRYEQARLSVAGCDGLAGKVEHVSRTRGDGAGFDVLSFETNGAERLIEVKTTKHGIYTPFFLTSNELLVSQKCSDQYQLYRVFDFRLAPGLFTLEGNIATRCKLDACAYVARVA